MVRFLFVAAIIILILLIIRNNRKNIDPKKSNIYKSSLIILILIVIIFIIASQGKLLLPKIFQIINYQKGKLRILIGNLHTTIEPKEHLFRPA